MCVVISTFVCSCDCHMTEVEQSRAERILTPVKRGRKPGSGKKNIVKAITGKPVFVNVDMRKYPNGTVLLQVGVVTLSVAVSTQANVVCVFPGIPHCLSLSSPLSPTLSPTIPNSLSLSCQLSPTLSPILPHYPHSLSHLPLSHTLSIQNGFCRAFAGVSKCLDCGNSEGELPLSRYCRFLEFRK